MKQMVASHNVPTILNLTNYVCYIFCSGASEKRPPCFANNVSAPFPPLFFRLPNKSRRPYARTPNGIHSRVTKDIHLEEVGKPPRVNSCDSGLWAGATESRQVHTFTYVLLQHFLQVAQCAGVDPTSGIPSTFKMMKLAANSEFRGSLTRVTEEMKKAGLDLTSPVRCAGYSTL